MGTLIDLLIVLAVLVIVALVLWFLFTKVPLPEPIRSIVLIVVVVVVAIIAIYFLLSLRGGHFSLSWLDAKDWALAALNQTSAKVINFLA